MFEKVKELVDTMGDWSFLELGNIFNVNRGTTMMFQLIGEGTSLRIQKAPPGFMRNILLKTADIENSLLEYLNNVADNQEASLKVLLSYLERHGHEYDYVSMDRFTVYDKKKEPLFIFDIKTTDTYIILKMPHSLTGRVGETYDEYAMSKNILSYLQDIDITDKRKNHGTGHIPIVPLDTFKEITKMLKTRNGYEAYLITEKNKVTDFKIDYLEDTIFHISDFRWYKTSKRFAGVPIIIPPKFQLPGDKYWLDVIEGAIIDYFTNMPGEKYDKGKLRYDLVPVECLRVLAEVLTYGADKYSPNNWKKLETYRMQRAMMEHFEKRRAGKIIDEESGFPHMAQAFTNMMFLLWQDLNGCLDFDPEIDSDKHKAKVEKFRQQLGAGGISKKTIHNVNKDEEENIPVTGINPGAHEFKTKEDKCPSCSNVLILVVDEGERKYYKCRTDWCDILWDTKYIETEYGCSYCGTTLINRTGRIMGAEYTHSCPQCTKTFRIEEGKLHTVGES